MLGQVYAGKSMYPSVEGYVDNPADRVAGLAGISSATAGNVGRVASAVDTTERAYNMAISNVMDRFLSFAQLQQQQRQWEREMDLKQQELALKTGSGNKTEIKRQALAALYGGKPDAQGNIVLSALGAGQQPKVTKEGYLLASQLDPDNSNEYWQKYQDENKAATLSPAQQKTISAAFATKDNVEKLYALWQKLPAEQKGPESRSIGRLTNLAQGGPFGQNLPDQYDKMRESIAYQIARNMGGATGTMNREALRQAMSGLPTRYEAEPMAEDRFARLLEQANQNYAFANGGGVNTPLEPIASSGITPQVSAGVSTQQIPVYDTVTGGYGRATQEDIRLEPNRFKVLSR